MDYESLILVFASIIYEALPFIVLGVVLAGLLEEFVPQQAIAKIIPRNRFLAIGLGALLGAVFPMCECGIIVVMRRLLRKGLPLSVCVAYMLAGPVINVVVLGSTYVAFDFPNANDHLYEGGAATMVGLRAGLAFLVAIVTGWVVEIQWRRYGTDLLHPMIVRGLREGQDEDDNAGPKTLKDRLGNISETALHDFVDIMAFLILGAFLASAGRVVLQEGNFIQIIQGEPAIAILLMMGIAALFCLCSEADAFVAANFLPYWPPASKLAFLVLGPMFDIKLYLMYTRVFRPRLIFTIVICVVVQVFSYSLIVHYAPVWMSWLGLN